MRAVLLVGGLGTRLRSVEPYLPKTLASVGNGPFLQLLVRQLDSQAIHHLVMCTGYLAEHIERIFGNGTDFGLVIEYSKEAAPLGTAGALKLAQSHVQYEPEFLVLNGDSFLDIDFDEFIQCHRKHGGIATMAVTTVENSARYGTVHIGADSRVLGFEEKTGRDRPGIINAGVYLFSNRVFSEIPEGPSSLEHYVFPRLLKHGVYAVEQRGIFIDIGIPEEYARAGDMFDRLAKAAQKKRGGVTSIAMA